MARVRGMAGFWDDLWAGGQDWITGRVEDRTRGGRDSHIPYQESAQAQIANAYAMFARGQLTADAAIDAVNRARDYFLQLARQFGGDRAAAGARDVSALASNTTARINIAGGGVSFAGGIDLKTIALIGVSIFALRAITKPKPKPKRKRRRRRAARGGWASRREARRP
jgi:hypothetical protein